MSEHRIFKKITGPAAIEYRLCAGYVSEPERYQGTQLRNQILGSDKAKAAYIKTHGEAPNVAGDDDDDYDMGPDMDSRDYDMDDDDDKYDKYGQEMGGTPSKLNQETLMIDSKQYRRINESVKQKPKPKYEFSEFYQRLKR